MNSFSKIFLIVIINLFIGNYLYSQYKFGIQAGAGISNYVGADFSSDNDPKIGMTAGMYFEREINYTLSFGFEVNYEKKGTFYRFYPDGSKTVSVDSRLSYLTLPIYTKAYFGKNANYYMYLGVSASYLTDYQSSTWATEYGFTIPNPYFTYTYNTWDASVIGGVGLNFYEVILDIRYHHGIVDIFKGKNVPSIRNSFISATIGYSLYKKKQISCFNNRAY